MRPKAKPAVPPARVAVNGRFLDEVQTRIEYGYEYRGLSFLSLPAHHHTASQWGESLTLCTPALTALQLYHDGVLPVDRSIPVSVEVGGVALGDFRIEWLRCPERTTHDSHVLLRLHAVDGGDHMSGEAVC